MPRSCPSHSSGVLPRVLALAGFLLLLPLAAQAAQEGSKARSWATKAVAAEKTGAWLEACRCWEELLRKDSRDGAARAGHQRCLRHLQLLARHSDASYRQTLSRLKQPQALTTYEQVLQILIYSYPDSTRSDLSQLVQNGVHEVKLALDDSVFRQHYLAGVKPDAINAFKKRLAEYRVRKMTRTTEAREQVGTLVRDAAKDGLPVAGVLGRALVMEFAAGACNALDENSSFLTPGHLALMQSTVKSKFAGVGLDVTLDDNGPRVSRVYKDGPAAEKSLEPGDRILKVGGALVEEWTADAVAEKLRGKAGTTVELEIERKSNAEKVSVKLRRRAVPLPSVEENLETLPDDTVIGNLRINYFSDDTHREVKDAITRLTTGKPIEGLVLDLRGNPGGVFNAAVSVAELFLSGGVISVGQSAFPEFNRTFKTETPSPHTFPIVVLVDGETASAAEVLAAALKESRTQAPTRLMGQTTYGKGSIQCLIQLKNAPLEKMAGIRLTVAKLYSPSNIPITGKGIAPHTTLETTEDALAKARELLAVMISEYRMTGMGTAVAKNE